MNANELADVMEKYSVAGFQYPLCDEFKQAATMLRQQQAEIDEWKYIIERLNSILTKKEAEIEALKAHPVKQLNDGGEPVKNATYWKRQYNLMATQNDNLKSGLYHANEQIKYLESHPVKEQLKDEVELLEAELFVKGAVLKSYKEALEQIATGEIAGESTNYKDTVYVMRQIASDALAILRKAQEKC